MANKTLPEELHHWMVEEMKFVPQGRHMNTPIPTEHELAQITRGPQMVDIWKFVLHHVHSAQTVKKVKGNLALKRKTDASYRVKYKGDGKFDDTIQQLLDKRTRLLQEKKSLESDIHHLDNDLARVEQEVSTTETECEEKWNRIKDMKRKEAMLNHYSMQTRILLQQYKEYANQMQKRLNRVVDTARKGTENEEYYNRKKSSTDDDRCSSSSGLETKCSREVRRTCTQLGSFLLQVMEGEFGIDRNVINQKKRVVWHEVEAVLKDFSVRQIYEALIVNAQDATQNVREMCAGLDIRKDAEKLRFKFEKSGELKDLSSNPSILSSVNQLLQENYFHQCERLVETEKYKNESWRLEKSFEELSQQIDAKLHATFPKQEDVKLIRAYIDDKILLSGKRAALHSIHEEVTELREIVIQSQQQNEILTAKYRKIHDFQSIADRKQQVIRVLVKQNANAKARHDTQKKEITEYCKRSLTVHKTEVRSLKTGLQGSISTEVTKFTSLQLPYLLFTESDDTGLKVAVMDLSVHQLGTFLSTSTRPALQKVLEHIQFPVFKAPELVLRHCLDMKQEVEYLRDRSCLHQNVKSEDQDMVETLRDLCVAVKEQDEKLLKNLLPILQSRLDKSERALQKCKQVTERVQEWWEQPGQYTVSWERVEDNGLQHWKNRWNVLVTKIRQQEVKQ